MNDNNSKSRRLTADDAAVVWLLHWDGMIQSRIAARFDVNQGRICEVLQEKTHVGSKQAAAARSGRAA